MSNQRSIPRLRTRLARLPECRDDAGFTLIEVIVSFVIFSIVAASAGTAIYRAINASHETQQRVSAAAVAQAVIANAIAKANDGTAAPEQGNQIVTQFGDGTSAAKEQFTAVRTITFANGGTVCAPGSLFTVNVVVKQTQTGRFLARSDTQIACPPA